MKDILSKKDCRQLNLVERLYSDQHWITSACLAEELECSLRILKSDIQQLNEEFTEFLIESSYKGIRLKLSQI